MNKSEALNFFFSNIPFYSYQICPYKKLQKLRQKANTKSISWVLNNNQILFNTFQQLLLIKGNINNTLFNLVQQKIMSEDCTICCDEAKLFGITECNHGPFCYRCIYKMRVLDKNNCCPICKVPTAQIMISPVFDKFGSYKGEVFPDSNFGDVFHCGKQAKKQFQKLKEIKCFVKFNGNPCKNDKIFDNIAFLKKHLKQQHKRVLCDICLEKKTCTLEQQKLYTQAQLNRHLERGDVDELGNVIFLHPYCGFCKIYFFDEDNFKRHMNVQHIICNVCPNQYRYIYYKNYDSMETHYKISHYICSDVNCLAKKFIAFRSSQELKIHRNQYHSTGKKIDGKQLCGFNYGGIIMDEIIEIKDKEGIDMQDQFLTLKKSKNNAIGQADQQHDQPIDMRDFYHTQMEEEEHFHQSFVLKHHKVANNQKAEQQKNQQKGKKKKYIQKEQFQKEKPIFAKQNQQFTIQQLNLTRSLHLTRLHIEDFQNKLQTLLGNDDLKKLQTNRNKYNKRQMNSQDFVQSFFSIMKKISLRAGYQIFPHYIRTFQNQDAKNQLNLEYIKFLKRVPSKTKSMISQSKTYGQLFKRLLKQLQLNLQTRIKNSTLSIKKPILREKERLFQIIGVLRRLKTQEMSNFKFASNFGVQLDTSHLIHQKVFKLNIENTQDRLTKVPNDELIDLYVFTKYCYEAITHNQNMHLAKNKIHENVLEEFLFERPNLDKQYGTKKEDLKTLQEKVQYEKEQQEKNEKKKLREIDRKNKDFGYHTKTNFSLNDKGDFPDLLKEKGAQIPVIKQNFKDFAQTAKSKPATYQKKINQLFPSLGSAQVKEQQVQKQQKPVQKKQKAWWQKINEPRRLQEEEGQEVVKVRKGKNKNQKWVSGKGFFGH